MLPGNLQKDSQTIQAVSNWHLLELPKSGSDCMRCGVQGAQSRHMLLRLEGCHPGPGELSGPTKKEKSCFFSLPPLPTQAGHHTNGHLQALSNFVPGVALVYENPPSWGWGGPFQFWVWMKLGRRKHLNSMSPAVSHLLYSTPGKPVLFACLETEWDASQQHKTEVIFLLDSQRLRF